jgi:hypothetical protein
MKKVYIALCITILLVACIHVSVTLLDTSPSPNTPSHQLGLSINAQNMGPSSPLSLDSCFRDSAYRSTEFSTTTAVPEYGGGTVTIPMDDGGYLTTNGYEYFRPYQTE